MTRQESCALASARYVQRHPDRVKARWKAYREANKDKIREYRKHYRLTLSEEKKKQRQEYMKAYNKAYYSDKPRPKRIRKKAEPKLIEVPRDIVPEPTPAKVISMFVSCSYCESKFRRGTPEFYDGSFEDGEFCCAGCEENLEMEA